MLSIKKSYDIFANNISKRITLKQLCYFYVCYFTENCSFEFDE